jgi:hypothetical protein
VNVHQKRYNRRGRNKMAEITETAETKQKLQELKEKMLTLKEHL